MLYSLLGWRHAAGKRAERDAEARRRRDAAESLRTGAVVNGVAAVRLQARRTEPAAAGE